MREPDKRIASYFSSFSHAEKSFVMAANLIVDNSIFEWLNLI